ncbi:IS701 family transposase [Micromonospora pisi]|uniref:IS701 family transposase n=1 Tax=Micromonospora pisi TaxID=589240 RepID=UPI001FE70EB1|nr:transposase [Micromonospora pisi]
MLLGPVRAGGAASCGAAEFVTGLLSNLEVKTCWHDRQRCQVAGVPDEIEFATRSELAADMITAALDAGVPAGWAAADEAYGNSAAFRVHLREHRLGYVLAVSRSHLIPLDGGKSRIRADRVAAELPASTWQRRSAGAGSKGPRSYDWAWLDDVCADADPDDGGHHSLLIRRNTTTGELAFYRCWAPRPATLAQLVRVAGIRWTVEELPGGQGPGRPGSVPNPPLVLLAPVHRPRLGRPRRPCDLRCRRCRR